MNIGIIGAGAWGTAIAKNLSDFSNKIHNINIFSVEDEVVTDINKNNVNKKYLNKIILNDRVLATNNINDLCNSELIFLVTPVQFTKNTIKKFKNEINAPIIICSKGIDTNNGSLVSEILNAELHNPTLGVLAGPSFASEFAQGLPAALVFAMNNHTYAEKIIKELSLKKTRLYTSNDIIGCQIGGALKNILAIASGITSGLKLGHNALSALLCRGTRELAILIQAKNGNPQTAYGLSGLGDLILTGTSEESRNFSLGLEIARNNRYSHELSPQKSGTAEGYFSAKAINFLAMKYDLNLPLCNEIYQILYNKKSLQQAMNDILNRTIKSDF